MLAQMPLSLLNPLRSMAQASARELVLPHFTGAKKPVGATRPTHGAVARVVGSPSMRLVREGGGVKTILRRNMTNADLLSDDDLKLLQTLLKQVETEAKRLSNGGLSYRDLRRMRHPYGKGFRVARRSGLGRLRGSGRGVSNMAVVNRHSGAFERGWNIELLRDKSGVSLILENDSEVSAYLAFGTRKMRAHGPFSTSMAKYLSAIDAEWRRLARMATARENALAQVKAGAS